MIDEPNLDAVIDEFRRMGARWPAIVDRAQVVPRRRPDRVQRARPVLLDAGRARRLDVDDADKVLLAPLPADLDELAAHPFIAEKLMPVLGVVRSPSVEHAIAACELVTEHDGLGHTSAIYATDDSVIDRFALASGPDPR